MKDELRQSKLVVLIDADNTSPTIVEPLLQEIAKFGIATVKRIYGDWTRAHLKGWKEVLLIQAIQPIQQFGYTVGKNSTDSAMIIDAMDLLYTKNFDAFCIVSSDSDFTRLASRIRESGALVYGFGEKKTPKPFISACDRFIYTEILKSDYNNDSDDIADKMNRKMPMAKLRKDTTLVNLLRGAVTSTVDEFGWSNLAAIGLHIANHAPEFDPRNYGYAKLNDLAKAIGLFEIDERASEKAPNIKHIFLKEKHKR